MANAVVETNGIIQLDTTRASVLHGLFGLKPNVARTGIRSAPVRFLAIVLLSYGTMLATVILLEPSRLVQGDSTTLKVPFLSDWSTLCQLLATLPLLTLLLLSERWMIPSRLLELFDSGVFVAKPEDTDRFCRRWQNVFVYVNVLGQLTAGLIAGIVTAANYVIYKPSGWGSWQAVDGRFGAPGYLWLFWIFMFYFISVFYLVRATGFYFLLRAATRSFEVHLQPFHPDGCGGLKPIGILGLRNQYLLVAAGMNIVLLAVTTEPLPRDPTFNCLLVAAVVFYFVGGPIAFVGPLLPFRPSMVAERDRVFGHLGRMAEAHYTEWLAELSAGQVTKEVHEASGRLRELLEQARRVPVWPFDVRTIRRFGISYIVPVLPVLASPLFLHAKDYFARLLDWLN